MGPMAFCCYVSNVSTIFSRCPKHFKTFRFILFIIFSYYPHPFLIDDLFTLSLPLISHIVLKHIISKNLPLFFVSFVHSMPMISILHYSRYNHSIIQRPFYISRHFFPLPQPTQRSVYLPSFQQPMIHFSHFPICT